MGGSAARLGLALVLAAAVTAVLVIVGRVHQPDYSASIFGQIALGALRLKSWIATVTLGLAGLQVLLALWLYRKLPFAPAPARWVGVAHRLTGVVLLAVTIPGGRALPDRLRSPADTPEGGGSLAGGLLLVRAFAAKVLLVQSKRLPGWVLPVVGGTLVVVVIVLWYTAALYYFNGFQLPHL
jgi:hypothetical protein